MIVLSSLLALRGCDWKRPGSAHGASWHHGGIILVFLRRATSLLLPVLACHAS